MLEETEGPRCGGKKAADNVSVRAEQLFKDLDRDGDGSVTMEEFVAGYIRLVELH